jgi:hypothetical protein
MRLHVFSGAEETGQKGLALAGVQVEWVSLAKTMSVIFPLKKHMSAIFCLSHDSNETLTYDQPCDTTM